MRGFPRALFILGPLLFLLFINDIVTDIKASIKLFADDTSLYVTVNTSVVGKLACKIQSPENGHYGYF
jgi:hypothetical protein